MLQIVMPIGGRAARFEERGYTFPKPLIEIGNRSMIEVVLDHFAPPKPHQYIFICRKEHLAQFYLGDVLRLLAPGCRVIPLEQDTGGALCSVLLAIDHLNPDEELMVRFYERACGRLGEAGVRQYEISNFAVAGMESRHNLKYWERRPYLGFGVDAHSMLPGSSSNLDAVRLAAPDSLPVYAAAYDETTQITRLTRNEVSFSQAWEETFFLGLRLNAGVDLREISRRFGDSQAEHAREVLQELIEPGLVEITGGRAYLTAPGRLVSNEVFEKFVSDAVPR